MPIVPAPDPGAPSVPNVQVHDGWVRLTDYEAACRNQAHQQSLIDQLRDQLRAAEERAEELGEVLERIAHWDNAAGDEMPDQARAAAFAARTHRHAKSIVGAWSNEAQRERARAAAAEASLARYKEALSQIGFGTWGDMDGLPALVNAQKFARAALTGEEQK